MVVRQRSSAGSQDPTISTSSAARKAKQAALLEKIRQDGGATADRVVPRRFRKPVLPITDAPKPQRRRAYSDEGILDSLGAALDRAEEVMDRRTLPLHEALDEVNFETASHQDYSRGRGGYVSPSSSSVRSSRSRRTHYSRRSARREREKEEAKLRSRAALPLHYRLRTAGPASKIGFGLAVLLLHAALCALLATFHTWPAARPYFTTAMTEFSWTARRWTGAESRPVDAVLADIRYLSEKRDKTVGEIDRLQAEASSEEEAGEMAFVVKALEIKAKSEKEKLAFLRRELQFLSREAVIEHFGEGPHYVRFDLDFSPDSSVSADDDDGPKSFVVRMAPLSAAPHSVHVFLEQISQSFWDGKSFLLNPGHLVMATSTLVKNGVRSPEVGALEDARALAPAFPEYSEAYPHRPHTLGFVANRDAPHFYVNTKDNAEIHGPGMQVHHTDVGSADPCFAEVVSGLDAVERISKLPTKAGGPWLKGKVRIQSARIVSCPSGECD